MVYSPRIDVSHESKPNYNSHLVSKDYINVIKKHNLRDLKVRSIFNGDFLMWRDSLFVEEGMENDIDKHLVSFCMTDDAICISFNYKSTGSVLKTKTGVIVDNHISLVNCFYPEGPDIIDTIMEYLENLPRHKLSNKEYIISNVYNLLETKFPNNIN